MNANIGLEEEGHQRILEAIAVDEGQIPWRQQRAQRFLKRVFDIVVAFVLTILLLPLAVIVGILVRVTSTGPVLLAQTRIGLDGVSFRMCKFRSMRAELPDGSARGSGEVTQSDSRLTPIGGWIRAWRFDELPQLIHVLSGRMSLVGPRPDIPENLALYSLEQLLRFSMPPGCTAWTFTRGMFANDWSVRQDINVEYVKNWSLGLDLEILVGSLFVLLSQKNTTPAESSVHVLSRRNSKGDQHNER
jgi:lipopolysaccharide/colanic/teichoic acid biosynthesis glycosyltransferase